MKLVDILARGLKAWPEVLECLSQQKGTGYIINGKGFDGRAFDALEIADETLIAGAIVTRAEWQSAVDALNALKAVEWDGVSLPPKGTAVEVRFACEKIGSEWPWHFGIVVASGPQPEGGVMVAVEANGFTVALRVTSDFIRPARTAEQVAAEEREKAINEMVFGVCGCEPDGGNTTAFMICGFIYDAGYRKDPKSCGS